MILFNNTRQIYILFTASILAILMLATAAFAQNNTPTQEINTKTIATIKQEILNDAAFINSLKSKLNIVQSDDNVKRLVKDYLLDNPEIMLEVQQALNQKQEELNASKQAQIIQNLKDEIFNAKYDAIIGNPNGKITLVEFYDYNCGYCKRAQPDIDSLIKKNPDLKVVLKDFAILGDDSVKAHIVAQAFLRLMPEKYAQFHEELLLGNGTANHEKAMDLAVKLGADKNELDKLIKDKALEEPLQQTLQIAYALGINGTPTFIIGDKMIVGAVGEDRLQQAISDLRKE